MVKLVAAAGLTALLAGLPGGADDKPTDTKALVGGYTIVSGEKDGKAEPEERVKGSTALFTADTVTVTDKDKKQAYVATYKLDTSRKPWAITMTSKQAKEKEVVAHGLVEATGDTVKLIYALPGGERPTEFKAGKNQLLFTMKKLEPAKAEK